MHEMVIAEKTHKAICLSYDQNALINSSRPACEAAISYSAFGTGTVASATSAVRHGVAQPNIAAAPFAAAADPV